MISSIVTLIVANPFFVFVNYTISITLTITITITIHFILFYFFCCFYSIWSWIDNYVENKFPFLYIWFVWN